jgi:hypothetical protein
MTYKDYTPKQDEEIARGQALLMLRRAEHEQQQRHKPVSLGDLLPSAPTPTPKPEPKPQPETKPERKPATVKTWPIMGLRADQSNAGGPWRIWTLARTLDRKGSGAILRDDLQAYCTKLGLPRGTFRRWLAEARKLGIITEREYFTGSKRLILAGADRAAELLGCPHVGGKRAAIPVNYLIGEGWKAYIWAGYIATLRERPASRETMRKMTGVPERTQQEYERQAGIVQLANYAHDEAWGAEHLAGIRENERPHAFTWHDRETDKKIIVWRTPDTRIAPADVSCASKGRTRKVNKKLNHVSSFCMERASTRQVFRLFHDDPKSVKATIRKISKADLPPWKIGQEDGPPAELYELKPGGKNCQQWRVEHVNAVSML